MAKKLTLIVIFFMVGILLNGIYFSKVRAAAICEDHPNSYMTKCTKAHCKQTYCVGCGHNCGGGHAYTTCRFIHCKKYYCRVCGHSCGGDCSTRVCSLPHCQKTYCIVEGCTKYPHDCGGDHVWGKYKSYDLGCHYMACSVEGCTQKGAFYSHTKYTTTNSSTEHSIKCTICDYNEGKVHYGGIATCTAKARCSACGTEYGQYGSHNNVTCNLFHCKQTYCTRSGCGQNNHNCGGDCNTLGYCNLPHCLKTYCNKCYTTPEAHQASGYCGGEHKYTVNCSKIHCTSKICSIAGCGVHQTSPCGGGHVYNETCAQTHCTIKICTINNCGEHQVSPCGGGCTEGDWASVGTTHYQICTKGCTRQLNKHDEEWGVPNTSHIATCTKCTLTKSHTAIWGVWLKAGMQHERSCAVATIKGTCLAKQTHAPVWGAFTKDDGANEANSTANHTRVCTICGLKDTHTPEWSGYTSISDNQHKRTCIVSGCTLPQTESHDIYKYTDIDNMIYHKIECSKCTFTVGDENVLALHKNSSPVDEKCDLCNAKIWRQLKYDTANTQTEGLTNKNLKIKVEVFDENKPGDNYIQTATTDTFEENGTKDVTFTINEKSLTLTATVDNINKTVKGRVQVPMEPTTGKVTAVFRPDYEGYTNHPKNYNKEIEVEIKKDGITIEKKDARGGVSTEITANGEYVYELSDSLGNTKTITINVDCIVSGKAAITTTFDVMEGGYIFTNILMKATEQWKFTEADINVYRVGSNETIKAGVKKMEIIDEYGNRITGEENIPAGTYYIKVAVGGKGVFTLPAGEVFVTYIVDLSSLYLNEKSITMKGENSLQVNAQALNNLT